MGFVYPLIGLICFAVPICVFWGKPQEDTNFEAEEDLVHEEIEKAHIAGIKAQLGKQASFTSGTAGGKGSQVMPVSSKLVDDIEN